AATQARQAHDRGDSDYATFLQTAQVNVATAEKLISAAMRSAVVARRLWMLIGLSSLASALAAGWALNRRRQPLKNECLALLKTWETGLGEKNVALFELLDRVSTVVGASTDEAAQRYAGETLRLSQQIIKDVDELFIMSACTGRVLRDAQALAFPAGALQRACNHFSRRRYRAALHLLRDQPISFKPEEALELVVRGPKSERDTLLGHLESYQPFTMSFTQLIDAFNDRAKRALEHLDRVEHSLIQIGKKLEMTQENIRTLRAKEALVASAGDSDGLFRVPAVFAELLPAAEGAVHEAIQIALKDPVTALHTHGAAANQRVNDGLVLVDALLQFRKISLPEIMAARDRLRAAQIHVAWIDEALREASAAADALAQSAVAGSAAEAIEHYVAALVRQSARVAEAERLETMRSGPTTLAIEQATRLVQSARTELGQALKLPPDQLLRETNADPSMRLREAGQQSAAAKAALDRGDVESASDALEESKRLTDEATAIVCATQREFGAYAEQVRTLRVETERLLGMTPSHELILHQLAEEYVSEVLQLGAGDPAHPNANGTIADNLDETRAALTEAKDLHGTAQSFFKEGKILQAAELLRQVRARHELAAARLKEIEEKHQRLQSTEKANIEQLESLQRRARDLELAV
ncbi:MAG: hypothetical protein AB1813_29510, partial [Verrucomicrobiota bacterium]